MLCVRVSQHFLSKLTRYLCRVRVSGPKIAKHVAAQSLSSRAESSPSRKSEEAWEVVVVTWKRELGEGKVGGGHEGLDLFRLCLEMLVLLSE